MLWVAFWKIITAFLNAFGHKNNLKNRVNRKTNTEEHLINSLFFFICQEFQTRQPWQPWRPWIHIRWYRKPFFYLFDKLIHFIVKTSWQYLVYPSYGSHFVDTYLCIARPLMMIYSCQTLLWGSFLHYVLHTYNKILQENWGGSHGKHRKIMSHPLSICTWFLTFSS